MPIVFTSHIMPENQNIAVVNDFTKLMKSVLIAPNIDANKLHDMKNNAIKSI